MNKLVAIPKDTLNRLQLLAASAIKDDEAYIRSETVFRNATTRAANSTGQFANELYAFALRYVEQPDLINAKLAELEIRSKQSSSVLQRITRLAFSGLKDSEAPESRAQIAKYSGLIERAYEQRLSIDAFQAITSEGVTRASDKLGPRNPSDVADKVAAGRLFAEQLIQKEISVALPTSFEPLPEGSQVQLLAHVKTGSSLFMLACLWRRQK